MCVEEGGGGHLDSIFAWECSLQRISEYDSCINVLTGLEECDGVDLQELAADNS